MSFHDLNDDPYGDAINDLVSDGFAREWEAWFRVRVEHDIDTGVADVRALHEQLKAKRAAQ